MSQRRGRLPFFPPLPILFNNVDSWKERGEDVVAPLIGWKKRNHGREQTNEGADVTMRGVVTYKLDSCLPISRLPTLSPTRVNCPSWGATPQSWKAKVIPAPSEWLRSSKTKQPGVTVLNGEQEYDLFSTHQISWLFEAHWILPTIYKPYACTEHTPVYFLMCHIPVMIDWNTRGHFYINLICTCGLLTNLSSVLGSDGDRWLHSLHQSPQRRISQFPTEVPHVNVCFRWFL